MGECITNAPFPAKVLIWKAFNNRVNDYDWETKDGETWDTLKLLGIPKKKETKGLKDFRRLGMEDNLNKLYGATLNLDLCAIDL